MDLVRGRGAWSTTITTRFNAQLACLLGAAIYISDPLPGWTHGAKGIRLAAGRRDCRALRWRDRG